MEAGGTYSLESMIKANLDGDWQSCNTRTSMTTATEHGGSFVFSPLFYYPFEFRLIVRYNESVNKKRR
ncbi:hypothetical protein GMA19_02123 [Paenibacillus polymyxa E681]|nr:hypothetical protein GE561_02123 [Paenibacillus polymyxa E681]QNV61796.1 hypothetical protein GMA19_02123 [Paenibacillus polymyxa E681]